MDSMATPTAGDTTLDSNVSVTTEVPTATAATLFPAMVLSPSDKAYISMTIITGVLSVLGSTLIIFTFVVYKDIQTTSRRLLIYLSIADLLTALGNIIGVIGYMELVHFSDVDVLRTVTLCKVPTYLTLFSSMSSFWWTGCIAVYLFICIVKSNHALAEKLVTAFHVCCWLIPVTIASVALGTDVLGYDSKVGSVSWCWIKGSLSASEQLFWQFLTGPIWQILAILISVTMYTWIKCHIRSEMRNENLQYISQDTLAAIAQANNKLTFVPLVFVFLRIWGTLRFLVDLHMDAGITLQLLQGVGDSSQGFANSILFCLCTPKIRNHLAQSVKTVYQSCSNYCIRRRMSSGILRRTSGAHLSYNQVSGNRYVAARPLEIRFDETTPINRCLY